MGTCVPEPAMMDVNKITSSKARGGRRRRRKYPKKKNVEPSIAECLQRKLSEQNLNLADISIDDPISRVGNGTAIIYNEFMLKHRCEWGFHPECPERMSESFKRLQHYGLLDRCTHIPANMCAMDDIKMLHSDEYIEKMRRTSQMTVAELRTESEKYDSIYINNHTWDCSHMAIGSAISLTDKVIDGEYRNGAALIRPPGHHGLNDEANGFCFFNNVALCAKHAVSRRGLKRVLILDWDVHHGQATQYHFEGDPTVMYMSMHRYERTQFWPHLTDSNYDFVGSGSGAGYNINLPWNKIKMTDSDYIAAFQQVIMPIAYEFDPELVLVSAGYDAAIGDPKGQMEVTPACYSHMINMLNNLAQGKVCLLLEGGYNVRIVAESFAMSIRALLGDPCPPITAGCPSDSCVETILKTISCHKQYWNCFRYQVDVDDVDDNCLSSIESSDSETHSDETNEITYSDETPVELEDRITTLIENTELLTPLYRTGLVYDEGMLRHSNIVDKSGQYECPERLVRVMEKLTDEGLVNRCHRITARQAVESEVSTLHSEEHIDAMRNTTEMNVDELSEQEKKFTSIYLNQHTYDSALLAVGSTISLVDKVCDGTLQNGVAVVRPPGHHAESDSACGFCIFNNVALAAKHAQQTHNHIKRVLIVDWDIHHGNGTQRMFENDPSVLYMSLHRYGQKFFPQTEEGSFRRVGLGAGEGYTVNVNWAERGVGDAEYIAAFQQIIMPIAYEFSPDLVLISGGFDAARGDPLGRCLVTPEGFAHMTNMLMSLASGRVVLTLEGGYSLTSLSDSLAACTHLLLGDACPPLSLGKPSPRAVRAILDTLHTQAKYWSCLQYQVDIFRRFTSDAPQSEPLDQPSMTSSVDLTSLLIPERNGFESTSDSSPDSGFQSSSCEIELSPKIDESMTSAAKITPHNSRKIYEITNALRAIKIEN